jgi:hypothetical protein
MIYKFPLRITDYQEVTMHKGARIMSVGNQNGVLCIWAHVDPKAEPEKRAFHVVGTGHTVPVDANVFIGTVIIDPFVWHVFEEE